MTAEFQFLGKGEILRKSENQKIKMPYTRGSLKSGFYYSSRISLFDITWHFVVAPPFTSRSWNLQAGVNSKSLSSTSRQTSYEFRELDTQWRTDKLVW